MEQVVGSKLIPAASGSTKVWLRWYSKAVVLAVFYLIFAGALVTSHGAGLSVPDWPTTFGENMFAYPSSKWVGGVFYEHTHRLIASGVGVLTLILVCLIWLTDRRPLLRKLALAAILLVLLQGMLGGLTVLFKLPLVISAAHGITGQTFFMLTIVIAYLYSREFDQVKFNIPSGCERTFFRLSLALTIAVYLQLIIGALMRHSEAGLAIPDFPTMAGGYWPTFDDAMLSKINASLLSSGHAPVEMPQILVHFVHRFWAVMVLIAFITTLIYCYRKLSAATLKMRTLAIMTPVVGLQVILGIATVLTERIPLVTSLHVVVGALLLGLSTLLSIRASSSFLRR